MKKLFSLLFAGSIVALVFSQSIPVPGGGRAVRSAINESTATPGQVLTLGTNANYYSSVSGGGGGSAPTGTMVNTTATTAGQVFVASDTTKTNAQPTSTLTGIRITPRVATLTDAATVTPDVDSYDGGKLTSLSQATTFANPTGTPTAFQRYVLRVKSSSVRAISFGTQYRGSLDLALPTSTSGGSLTDYLVFQYNSDDTKWDLVGKNFGF